MDAQAEATAVRAAVSASTSCNNTTVTSLQQLLGITKTIPQDVSTNTTRSARVTATKLTAKAASVARDGRAKRDTKAIAIGQAPGLTPREQYKLATDIINVTLKVLAGAAKDESRPGVGRTRLEGNDIESPCHGVSPPSAVRTGKKTATQPLKEIVNPPATPKNPREISCCSPTEAKLGSAASLAAVAECSRLAFSYLRSSSPVKLGLKALAPFQIEQGMLALIGKMIHHEMDVLAIKELRILKRRFEKHAVKDGARGPTQTASPEKETIPSLLSVQLEAGSDGALPLAVTYQAYVMKVISKSRNSATVEALADYLEPSNPQSPCALIVRSVPPGGDANKAARQLEALTQSVLGLCPLPSSTNDSLAADHQRSPSPDASLRLQAIALKMRRIWWKLAGHQANEAREILFPLTMYLGAFSRRSRSDPMSRYGLAASVQEAVLGKRVERALQPTDKHFSTICGIIGAMARDAGLLEEALQWAQSMQKGASTSDDEVLCCVRTFTLALQTSTGLKEVLKSQARRLRTTMQKCDNISSTSMRMIIEELALLRKAVLKKLVEHNKDPGALEDTLLLCDILFDCVDYLGWLESGCSSQNVSKLFIDSALFAAKICIPGQSRPVEQILRTLNNCRALSTSVDESGPFTMHINLSNAYWLQFLTASRHARGTDKAGLEDILLCSIDTLRPLCLQDQYQGFIVAKLERYGAYLKETDRYSEACKIFKEAVCIQTSGNALRKITDAANNTSLRLVVCNDDEAQTLQRLLILYQRAATKSGLADKIYDEVALAPAERAALLEIQLVSIEKTTLRHREQNFSQNLTSIYEVLLDHYESSGHPLRRAVLSYRIIHHMFGRRDDTYRSLLERALGCPGETDDFQSDHGLSNFSRHIFASLSFSKAIWSTTPDNSDLHKSIGIWSAIFDQKFDWKDVEGVIDDAETLIMQLNQAACLFATRGDDYLRLSTLQLILRLHSMKISGVALDPTSAASEVLLQYAQMGLIDEGLPLLRITQESVDRSEIPEDVKAKVHLAQAALSLCSHDMPQAAEALCSYRKITSHGPSGKDSRLAFHQGQAEAWYMSSSYLLLSGSPSIALNHAKRGLRLYQSLLASAKSRKPSTRRRVSSSEDSGVDGLASELEQLVISQDKGVDSSGDQYSNIESSTLWLLAPGLFRGFINLSKLYAYQGIRPEASYYAGQAAGLARSVQSPKLELEAFNLAMQHVYLARAPEIDMPATVQGYLDSKPDIPSSRDVEYHVVRGDILAYSGSVDASLEAYGEAERLALYLPTTLNRNSSGKRQIAKVPQKAVGRPPQRTRAPVASSVATKANTVRAGTSTGSGKQSTRKGQSKASQTSAEAATTTGAFDELLALVARRKALLYLQQLQVEPALKCMSPFSNPKIDQTGKTERQIILARSSLLKGYERLAADVTYNVLPESTIAMPTLGSLEKQQQATNPLLSPPQDPKVKSAAISKRSKDSNDIYEALQDARQHLASSLSKDIRSSSLPSVYQICNIAGTVTMLLSAISAKGLPNGALHPVRAMYALELPEIEAARRRAETVALEKRNESLQEGLAKATTEEHFAGPALSPARFQQDYVEIIPQSWTAISIGLSEDCSELLVARYHANQTPFLLRLPMSRHKMDELEDDTAFDFAAGRAELKKIIELSDYSCHHAPDTSVKGAKSDWWAEREALDHRMHELLINMENIWLGGFKGILSQHTHQPELLARFRKSLENILDQHLPSRQGTKGKSKGLTLDSSVLELFIGLGDDMDGSIDMDDQVLDLLYFVVDILQFGGEHNAYDELDFDLMSIETLDAMRAYHEASTTIETGDKHVILVLDKRLHAFPWESLPCLEKLSVSRVGSMFHLRERILAMRRQQQQQQHSLTESQDTFTVAPTSGTYILNPSADLAGTQATLSPLLSPLAASKSWTAITRRAPSEADFTTALSTSSMLLYFGHGSGNQYVRNRAIKKLDVCAPVVWLIGCSSGAVEEAGGFQPESVPLSYLVAGREPNSCSAAAGQDSIPGERRSGGGDDDDDDEREHEYAGREGLCMAVVATLWDVTDKDIDRFSVRVGDEWALWSSASPSSADSAMKSAGAMAPPKTPAKRGRAAPKTPGKTPAKAGRSRSRVNAAVGMKPGRKKSLVEAVVKGREACYLKFLNGAAVVVYGVPVYLGPSEG